MIMDKSRHLILNNNNNRNHNNEHALNADCKFALYTVTQLISIVTLWEAAVISTDTETEAQGGWAACQVAIKGGGGIRWLRKFLQLKCYL